MFWWKPSSPAIRYADSVGAGNIEYCKRILFAPQRTFADYFLILAHGSGDTPGYVGAEI